MTPIIEIVEPKELTKFQPAKESAKSEYRLGKPEPLGEVQTFGPEGGELVEAFLSQL